MHGTFPGGLVGKVGPWIHVMLTWQRVIRRKFFTWIGDIMDPGESMWQPLIGQHLSALDWSGVKVHGFLPFLMLNTCIQIDIDTGGKYEFKHLF